MVDFYFQLHLLSFIFFWALTDLFEVYSVTFWTEFTWILTWKLIASKNKPMLRTEEYIDEEPPNHPS